MEQLVDGQGRVVRKLRLSVTDQCNLRCSYCMPEEGLVFLKKRDLLSFEELSRLSALFVKNGVEHLRITGGEPLMRRELHTLIAFPNELRPKGLKSIGLTTNGLLLRDQAENLKQAGLDSVNISIDTADQEMYKKITRKDAFDRLLSGIRSGIQHFPGKVKLNAVIRKHFNDNNLIKLVELANGFDTELRFIEMMPLDAQGAWTRDQVMTGEEIRESLGTDLFDGPLPGRGATPAESWKLKSGHTLGFINSVTEPFCAHCDRVRLTADGALRNCLFSTEETPLKEALRLGASDDELLDLIRFNLNRKAPGHMINRPDFKPASRSISQVGG